MNFGPPLLLGDRDPLPGGGAHLPPGLRGLSLGRRLLGPGPQHPFDFGDVGVEPRPLGFETL